MDARRWLLNGPRFDVAGGIGLHVERGGRELEGMYLGPVRKLAERSDGFRAAGLRP